MSCPRCPYRVSTNASPSTVFSAAWNGRGIEEALVGHRSVVLISVLGTGYLGATHAACLAACGHTVVGVDTDPVRIELLRRGRTPFHEPGLDELLSGGVGSGRLSFTDDLGQAVGADVHFLCVGTPQVADGDGADL